MKVTIEPFIGRSVRSPAGETIEVRFAQYRVRSDGMTIGYIGTQQRARLQLITRFTPLEIRDIEDQVAELVGHHSGPAAVVPAVPDDVDEENQGILDDDIDS